MKKFEDITIVVTGTYPDTKAVASSTPTTPDGTPYLKALLDEQWGYIQALLNHAGITPDGVVESAAVGSQVMESIQKIAGYPGEIVGWMGSNFAAADPSVLGIRLLPLVGQTVLIANYVDLDAMVYVGNVLNPTALTFFRTSDIGGTTRNIVGPYLVLPDLRGYFLRGYDSTGLVDPDGAAHTVGSVQADMLADHEHYCEPAGSTTNQIKLEPFYLKTGVQSGYVLRDTAINVIATSPLIRVEADGIFNSQSPVGAEIRPKNITARWCIRY